MVVTGQKAVVKVGHHRAIEFVRWTLTLLATEAVNEPIASTVIGHVAFVDAFWSAYAQFSIGLFMGDSNDGDETWWIWENVRVVRSQGTISMVVIGKPSIRAVF